MFDIFRRYRLRRQMRRSSRMGRSSNHGSGRLLGMPGRIAGSIGETVRVIWVGFADGKRSFRDLLLGLPALAAFLLFIAATAFGQAKQRSNTRAYFAAGSSLLQSGDSQGAQVLLERAAEGSNVDQRDVMLSLALAYEQNGNHRGAAAMINTLAPESAKGHGRAHFYKAVSPSLQKVSEKDLRKRKDWHWHLRNADRQDTAQMQLAWGKYEALQGDLTKAIEHYRQASKDYPQAMLVVGKLQEKLSEDTQVVSESFDTAIKRLREQSLSDPDNVDLQIMLTQGLITAGRWSEGEKVLRAGLARTNDDRLRQMLAGLLVAAYDEQVRRSETPPIRVIADALKVAPNHAGALSRLVSYGKEASPENREKTRSALRRLVASGDASESALLALGSLDYLSGDVKASIRHMEQALAINPDLAVVANNLAYLMASQDEANLDAAMNLVSQALESQPQNPDYLDTRALIYQKQGQWEKAANDYLSALRRTRAAIRLSQERRRSDESIALLEDRTSNLQQRLAQVYEELGDSEMAKEFRLAAIGKAE